MSNTPSMLFLSEEGSEMVEKVGCKKESRVVPNRSRNIATKSGKFPSVILKVLAERKR